MDQKLNTSSPRYLLLLGFMIGLGALITTSYFFVKNFLQDRQRALSHKSLPPRPVFDRPVTKDGKQTKTYTAKELEEARKKGKLPPGISQPMSPNHATAANDAAVQRSLRTLEEINRINQMNQQLMEQTQRMQRQK